MGEEKKKIRGAKGRGRQKKILNLDVGKKTLMRLEKSTEKRE